MNINATNANAVSGFYAVDIETFSDTLAGSTITHRIDMGGGIVLHYGTWNGLPIWLMDNPRGHEAGYGIWIDDPDVRH
jgi:hypothetical protein